jgi:hypothetical protein
MEKCSSWEAASLSVGQKNFQNFIEGDEVKKDEIGGAWYKHGDQ